jgi:hypothetical protein
MFSSNFREKKILECDKLTNTTYKKDGTKEITIPTFFS